MQLEKTAQGMIRLYDKETGKPLDRWPVDARGMLASGQFSNQPIPGKEDEGMGATATSAQPLVGALDATRDIRFDPLKTPTMDAVLGATSPLAPIQPAEAVLGASSEAMTVLPSADVVGASAVQPAYAGELPKTTPLGQPAVHSTAADAKGASQADQAPVRTSKKGG
jgi:hypothetical protein